MGKRILAFIIICLLFAGLMPTSALAAQYYWNFNDTAIGSLPDGFTTAVRDGNVNYASQVAEFFPGGVAAAVGTFGEGYPKGVLMSSYFSPAGKADRWLITPALAISGQSDVLRWSAQSQDPLYLESYEVWISTASADPADFTLLQSFADEPSTFQQHYTNLSAYAGQTIYIAFRLVSNDMFVLVLDNIGLIDAVPSGSLAVNAGIDESVIEGDSITLNAAASGGHPPYSYEWKDGTTLIGSSAGVTVTPDANTTYICTVKDVAGTVVVDTVDVTVLPAVYTVTATPTDLDFGSETAGYGAPPSAQTVTIENTGNQSLELTQPVSTNYDIGTLSDATLAAGETCTFTVRPKAALPPGSYDETITVSTDQSASAQIDASFTVDGFRTLTDSATGIAVSGDMSGTAALTVDDMTLGSSAGDIAISQRQSDDRYIFLIGRNISLSGSFTGSLTVTLPVGTQYNGETVEILHTKQDGSLETITAVVANGKVTFSVTSLSPFAVFAYERLALSSSSSDGKIYVDGRITLTPSVAGGAWTYDSEYLSRSDNTFTGRKTGTTTVTYTYKGQSASYTITIQASQLPATGQNFTWVWVLGALALVCGGIATLFFRTKRKHVTE
jgi:LPXTG-motif cell wall-anchored protein